MSRAFKLPTCAVRSCKRCGACARRTAAAGMTAERAWKLFLLVPLLLLTRRHETAQLAAPPCWSGSEPSRQGAGANCWMRCRLRVDARSDPQALTLGGRCINALARKYTAVSCCGRAKRSPALHWRQAMLLRYATSRTPTSDRPARAIRCRTT